MNDVNVRQITLKLAESIYEEIQSKADEAKMTVTDYLVSCALPDYKKALLSVDDVILAIRKRKSGDIFSLEELFTPEQWSSYSDGSHISAGRLFKKAYNNGKYDVDKLVKWVGKTSANLAKYQKL